MDHRHESTREQLLKASKLADLVGDLLDKYIEAKGFVIAETSGEIAVDNEQLLQEVDAYRERFADLVGIDPNSEERDELAAEVETRKGWRDE